MSNISVIIPIYNVEKYLSQCLDSVVKQTYRNLEIILVNDGSTDSCRQICDEYASNDARIKIMHKENGGLSDARNAGLKIATGDFISFVDSDDLLSVDFCEKLLHALLEYNADIAECGFRKFESDAELENLPEVTPANIELFETEMAVDLLIKDYLQPMVWNKLYRKEVLLGLKFPVGKLHEDVAWTYQAFGNAKKVLRIEDELYFYRQQADSISGRKYSLKRLDAVEALEERISYMRENFPKLENLAIKVFCFAAMSHYDMINAHHEIDPEKQHRNQIERSIRKYNTYSVLKKWDLKAIFWYQFFFMSPDGSLSFRKYINKVRNLE